jgi:hypothetical protein
MAELFSRLIRATIGASALATAMSLQPLTAAPAATGQARPAPAANASNGKRELRQDDAKDKSDKAKSDKAKGEKGDEAKKKWTKSERKELVKRAQVWAPTNIPSMDMRLGPDRPDSFQPGQEVTCDYVHEEALPGTSRKFNCAITKDDVVKVRYGEENGKVEGEVMATRLLWALGFGADAVYPVKVRCRGCSADPWVNRDPEAGERLFEPAAIERKFHGEEIKADKDGGWSWKELRHVDEHLGGAPLAQIDAMKLLAVFIQHTDNKIINERFVCLPGGLTAGGSCDRPFLYMHDVGLTFGHANLFDLNKEASVSFEDWVSTPMWRADPKMCVGHMRRSATGMLGDPQISEAGRKFLADLLVQLTDKQLRDLFEAAHVEHRSRKPGTEAPGATIDEWVNAFKAKRDEIVNNRCEK